MFPKIGFKLLCLSIHRNSYYFIVLLFRFISYCMHFRLQIDELLKSKSTPLRDLWFTTEPSRSLSNWTVCPLDIVPRLRLLVYQTNTWCFVYSWELVGFWSVIFRCYDCYLYVPAGISGAVTHFLWLWNMSCMDSIYIIIVSNRGEHQKWDRGRNWFEGWTTQNHVHFTARGFAIGCSPLQHPASFHQKMNTLISCRSISAVAASRSWNCDVAWTTLQHSCSTVAIENTA